MVDASVHKALSLEEANIKGYLHKMDYDKCPPKLCGNGNFHAIWSNDWDRVTCPMCLWKSGRPLPKEDPLK